MTGMDTTQVCTDEAHKPERHYKTGVGFGCDACKAGAK